MLTPDATRTALLPKAGPLNGSHIQANGGVPLRRLLAYQYEQAALPYSFDDLPNDSAKRLPTDRHCVVLVSIHKPELMDRSRQCLMEQLTENFGSHGSEKFFQ